MQDRRSCGRGGQPASGSGRRRREVAVVLPLYQKVRERYGHEQNVLCYDYRGPGLAPSATAACSRWSGTASPGTSWTTSSTSTVRTCTATMDDGERFAFFSRAVVQLLPIMEFWPEVIHCNDWQTALVPMYLKDDGVRLDRIAIRTVLTIHNIEYQGRYGKDTLGDLFGLDHGWSDDGTIAMDGDVNLLKGAMLTGRRRHRRQPHLRPGAARCPTLPTAGQRHAPVRHKSPASSTASTWSAMIPPPTPHRLPILRGRAERQGADARRSCRGCWACVRSPDPHHWHGQPSGGPQGSGSAVRGDA